jgi:hypothetical protein
MRGAEPAAGAGPDVAIATITLARDAGEEALLERALGALAAHGRPIAVSDGGSASSFVDAVGRLAAVRLCPPRTPGLVAQVTASVETASTWDSPFILYTESDKDAFFRDHLGAFLRQARELTDVDIAIAARSPAAFATFPEAQRQAEAFASFLCGEATGVPGDYFYGPFLFSTRLARLIAGLPPAIGWGWRPYLFAAAARRQSRIVMIEGNYTCPEDQRTEDGDDRAHRRRQLSQNISGVSLALRVV